MKKKEQIELFLLLLLMEVEDYTTIRDVQKQIKKQGYLEPVPTSGKLQDAAERLSSDGFITVSQKGNLFITIHGRRHLHALCDKAKTYDANRQGYKQIKNYRTFKPKDPGFQDMDEIALKAHYEKDSKRESILEEIGESFPYKGLRTAEIWGNGDYSVYVILLEDKAKERKRSLYGNPYLPAVYVGQSWYWPEERFDQHMADDAASSIVKRYDVELMWEIFEKYNPLPSTQLAEQTEYCLAEKLRRIGYTVFGGH